MPYEFKYDVFLGHNSKDKSVVRPLAERLRKDGVIVWCNGWAIANSEGAKRRRASEFQRSAFILQPMLSTPRNQKRHFISPQIGDALRKCFGGVLEVAAGH